MERAQIWHARVQGYCRSPRDPQVKHVQALVMVKGAGDNGAPVTLVKPSRALRRQGGEYSPGPATGFGAQTRRCSPSSARRGRDCGARPDGVVRVMLNVR